MAEQYLNDNATTLTGTWKDAAGSATGGFANDAELVIPGGGSSITSGLDQSASTSTGIRFFVTAESFSGNIGDGTAPMITEATDGSNAEWRSDNTEGRIEHNGTGTIFVKGDTNGIANLMQNGVGRIVLTEGTATYSRIQRGTLQVAGAATASYVTVLGGIANIIAKSGATNTAGTELNVYGGTVTIARPYTTINVYGGTLTINVLQAGGATTINQWGGVVVLLAHGNQVVTTYNHNAGEFDPTRLRVASTITTYIRQFGAIFRGRPNGAQLTITNSHRKDPNLGLI